MSDDDVAQMTVNELLAERAQLQTALRVITAQMDERLSDSVDAFTQKLQSQITRQVLESAIALGDNLLRMVKAQTNLEPKQLKDIENIVVSISATLASQLGLNFVDPRVDGQHAN